MGQLGTIGGVQLWLNYVALPYAGRDIYFVHRLCYICTSAIAGLTSARTVVVLEDRPATSFPATKPFSVLLITKSSTHDVT